MNTLRRKYNLDNAIIAADDSSGVSLERLVSLKEDGPSLHPRAQEFRKPSGLCRSVSMVAPQVCVLSCFAFVKHSVCDI